MADILFWLNFAFNLGMLIIPLIKETRGSAIFSVCTQLLAATTVSLMLARYYPGYSTPEWREGTIWALAAWALLISGIIVAVRKPTRQQFEMKRNTAVV